MEEQNNMVSFPRTPQIDDEPPNDMVYFPQTPQTSQIESESGSNLDSNEEEEISVKRKMGTPMTYGQLDHYALTVQTGEDVVSEMFSISQRTSRSLWILSATVAVLDVVLRKPGSSGGLLNFQKLLVLMEEQNNMVTSSQSPQTESKPNNEVETFMEPVQMNMEPNQDLDQSGAPIGRVELTGTDVLVKRKRGRPRKYEMVGEEGNMVPLVSASPGTYSGSYSESLLKRGRGRPKGSGKLQLLSPRGGLSVDPAGGGFYTQVLTAETGEDIVHKILSLSETNPRSLCILTATGVVCSAVIRQPSSYTGILRFKGRFQILTLSGSFVYDATQNRQGKTGMLSVALCHPDGNIFGGAVAGALIAAEPVQIIATSFLQETSTNTSKELTRTHPAESSTSTSMLGNSSCLAMVPLLMPPPTIVHDESCISPTSALLEFPSHSGVGNVIAANHNMNPAMLLGFGQNALQPMPDPTTSPHIDTFIPQT